MKKCDVLYIHSTKNQNNDNFSKFAIMPVGIIGILNNLTSKGIEVLGYNYAIEKHLDPDFSISSLLSKIDYKILMTDLHWYEHSYGAINITEISKKIKPNTPTIIGGYTATVFSEEIMEKYLSVDYIITGDSDLPAEMLVNCLLGKAETELDDIPNILYRSNQTVVTSQKKWVQTSLDGIDFISTDFFEHKEYIPFLSIKGVTRTKSERWMCIARGCKYNCAYCCGANKNMDRLFNRCNILLRSPEKVAEDFFRLDSEGIDYIAPSHDFQMFGKNYYQTLFSEIQKKGCKPGLYLECFQLPTKDFIDELANTFDLSKTTIVLSPISGNEEIRRQNGKLFNNDSLYETISIILSKKLTLQIYYTQNPYGETKEQYEDTVFQMTYLRNMFNLRKKNIFYQRIVLDPLAGMRDFENINTQYNTFTDYYNYCLSTEDKSITSGFNDNCEVSAQEKNTMYSLLFE